MRNWLFLPLAILLVGGSCGKKKVQLTPTAAAPGSDLGIGGGKGKPLPAPFVARGAPTVDLGIALSGGGIRAATFSIGVLKALYDRGYLEHVDVVSSVSGGGYASYWMYRKLLDNPRRAFGDAAFHDDVFATSLCELESNANFFPNQSAIAGLINRRVFNSYEAAIVRTFGGDSQPDLPITAMREHVQSGRAPFLIHNASLEHPHFAFPHRFQRVVEFTSLWARNDSLGLAEWSGATARIPRWSEVVATAGAAFPPLKHEMPNVFNKWPSDSTLLMWDGGKTENLGALALIRREVKRIIIVDAGHDPSYTFDDYERLKHLLPSMGYTLSVPAIDYFIGSKDDSIPRTTVFSDSAVLRGEVRSVSREGVIGPVTSEIWYFKLSIPFTIQAKLGEGSKAYVAGKAYDDALESAWASEGEKSGCASQARVSNGFRNHGTDYFVYGVTDYQIFMRGSKAHRIMNRPPFKNFQKGGGRYDFPHTSTLDQSFYTDQLDAFVGLGFLMGSAMPTYQP